MTTQKPNLLPYLNAVRVTYKVPDILSLTEVEALINSVHNIKHKTLLMVIYSAGLRVSEAVNLRMSDLDSKRGTIKIRECKNKKERYVILSHKVYKALSKYWKYCQFTDYVFPGQKPNSHITTGTASAVFKKAKLKAGIKKVGGLHSLRHSFATHMLEADVDLFTISQLLGHASISTTARYLRFIPGKDSKIKSPLDLLAI